MPRNLWTLISCLCCLVPVSSLADEPAEEAASIFAALDTNGDGVLTSAEAGESKAKAFDRMLRIGDANQDGQLSRSEYLGAVAQDHPESREREGQARPAEGAGRSGMNLDRLFETADRNHDAMLTREELPEEMRTRLEPLFERLGKTSVSRDDLERYRERMGSGARPEGAADRGPMLGRLDRDGDGKVSADEIPDEMKARLQPLLDRFGGEPIDLNRLQQFTDRGTTTSSAAEGDRAAEAGDMPRRPSFARDGRPGPLALMRVLDVDRDGKITKAEFKALADKFGELDRDSDGALDERELAGPPAGFGDRPVPGRRPEGARPLERPGTPEQQRGRDGFFQRSDRNGDGNLSRDEAPEMIRRRFDELDSNADGRLTPDEFRKILDGQRRRGTPGERPGAEASDE